MADKLIDVPGFGPVAFPESMGDDAIALAIKNNMMRQPASSPLPERPANLRQPEQLGFVDRTLNKFPTSGPLADVGNYFGSTAAGASGIMRNVSKMAGMGEGIWPTLGARDGAARTIGELADPVAWTIGGGVSKALPYAPVLGGTLAQGVKALGQNALGGGIAGGTIGALSEKGDATTGAVFGALANNILPPVFSGIARGVGAAKNALYPSPGSLAVKAAGDKSDDVINALLASPKGQIPGVTPTVAEAAIPAGSTEFAALQKRAAEKAPSIFYGAEKANEAGRLAAIQGIGQDKAALAQAIKDRGEAAAENYGAIRGNLVSPKSDTEIMGEAIANRYGSKASALQDQGRFQTFGAQQENMANNWTPVPGMPRVPGRYSPHVENVAPAGAAAQEAGWIAKYRQNEKEFLEQTFNTLKNTVGMSDVSLTKFMSRPSMRDAIKDAAESAAEKGSYFPSSANAKFSVENLQRIKESLDAGINAATNAASAGRRPVLSPAELTDTRNAFVKWLSEKVPAWRDARLQYAADSVPINRMQVGQELEKALTSPLGTSERATTFANTVREAPRTIKKATGQNRFDELGEVLSPDQTTTVQNVLGSLGNQATLKDMAAKGMPNLDNRIGASQLPPTGMFQPMLSAARGWVNKALGTGVERGLEKLAPLMVNDPQRFALIMQAATPQQRQIIEGMLSQMATRGATVGGGILRSRDEPKGALASY